MKSLLKGDRTEMGLLINTVCLVAITTILAVSGNGYDTWQFWAILVIAMLYGLARYAEGRLYDR